MPECAPVSTHPGQEGLREAGFRAKTGLEEPHGQRFPVTCLALAAKRALCSPSLGVAIPQFLFALVLLIFSATVLGQEVGTLFSREYQNEPMSLAKMVDFAKHIWIPVVVLIAGGTASLTRIMRANLLDVLGQQYVQTARAKGLHERRVIWRHAVRNALHPLVMALGTTLPTLISGEVMISIVLNLPTTGSLYIRALIQKDMYLGVTFLLLLSILLIVGNLLADLLLAWVDPRVRLDES